MGDKRQVRNIKKMFAVLDNFHAFSLNEDEAAISKNSIKVRLEKLENIWGDFFDWDVNLGGDMEEKIAEFTEKFFETKANLLELLNLKNDSGVVASTSKEPIDPQHSFSQLLDQQRIFLEGLSDRTATFLNATVTNATTHDSVRLPKITIESFRGNYEAWPNFIDLYTTTVHDHPNLSNIHKFQILKGLLRDGPSDLIKDLLVTDANYESAFQKLKDRYAKQKIIVSTLIASFLDQPSASNGQASALRRLSDFSDEVLKGIKALGPDAESRDPWLLHLLLQKVDIETQQAWSLKMVETDYPTIDEFLKFLNTRCDAKESCAIVNQKNTVHPKGKPGSHVKSFYAKEDNSSSKPTCPHCKANHILVRCFKFKKLKVDERRKLALKYSVCFNCPRCDHEVNGCPINFTCKHCQQKHHSLLHIHGNSNQRPYNNVNSNTQNEHLISPVENIASNSNTNSPSVAHTVTIKDSSPFHSEKVQNKDNDTQCLNAIATLQTLLPTAIVNIYDISGQLQTARVLIDSASTASFVTESLVQRLGFRKRFSQRSLSGIGDTPAGSSKGIVPLTIQSRFSPEDQIKIYALVLNKVTSLIPSQYTYIQPDDQLRTLPLADPNFNMPSDVDILLGAERALHILTGQKILINPDIVALSTIFGWTVGGQSSVHASDALVYQSVLTTPESDLNATLQLFWKLEEIPTISTNSDDDIESHFLANTHKNSNGKYVVRLPLRVDHQVLGNSRKAAYSRLFAMERKFHRDTAFEQQYKSFMDEYIALGHMTKIPPNQIKCPDNECFYLPHHAVLKSDSLTTKLRVVFDGSCASSTGASLNDILRVGPTIQPDLVTTLLRFRLHSVVFTADIEKMYRQVLVTDPDKEFQRIVWRRSQHHPIEHFRLNTVTYGTSSAPYLAIRTLHQIADDNAKSERMSNIIKGDFYVDDLLSGCEDIEDAKNIIQELSEVLENCGFHLRKWRSNVKSLLQSLPVTSVESGVLDFNETSTASVKTLGLHWNPAKDIFIFKIMLSYDFDLTKRKLLSQIAKTFDPLGWLAPVTLSMKAIFQQLWKDKVKWDDELSNMVLKNWTKLRHQLVALEEIEIPRHIFSSSSYQNAEIHAFCDASTVGYAAVIYIRCSDSSEQANIQLLMSKSKVAPITPLTIPKLELSAALILANLVNYVKSIPEFEHLPVTAWCDSQCVLAWLAANPDRWEQFVANRTKKILQILPHEHWRYVRSKENPADLASRGTVPTVLVSSQLWWNGPPWLRLPISTWPTSVVDIENVEAKSAQKKPNSVASFTIIASENCLLDDLFEHCSSFDKIKRVIVRILLSIPRRYHQATRVDLLRHAETMCISYVQKKSFNKEINAIVENKRLPESSKLISLTPFIDNHNILRVKGRLQNSNLDEDAKHPMIIPKDHVISKLLIHDAHRKSLHGGPSLITNTLKQRYWILDCKKLARRYFNNCVECFKHRSSSLKSAQLMGNLPTPRVTSSRPFLYTGVDFAGPLFLRARTGRGNIPVVKGYIALFVCLSTKAVHLELVSALTTDAYIASLRRFISRRGIPSEIMSDNGTNFVGAKNELNELFKLCQSDNHYNSISKFLSQNEIKFSFTPPRSPHFGGLWEANIKSVKYHLKRICNTNLVFEEMSTLLAQIESLLNSRPLCPVTSDVDDLNALTPGHFLIGAPLTAIPEPNLEHINSSRLSRWQNVQVRVQSFWRRWSLEYLHNLQQRYKWQHTKENLNINDLVLVKEDNLAPSQWLLGRIVQVHPGIDDLIRVATVKTKAGVLKRPIVKLCRLPIED